MKPLLLFLILFVPAMAYSQIKFDAGFESGNINSVTTIDSVNYSVTTRQDIGGRWFYFRITGVKNKLIKVTLSNNDVNRPLYSYDNKEFYRFTAIESPRQNFFQRSFEEDTVYISYYVPYNFSYLQKKIKEWSAHKDVMLDTLGFTNHNLPIQFLTITDRAIEEKSKKSVWIHARTHPGETPSSWHLEGIISELLRDDEVIEYYKKNLIFYLVPFTNPDGVYYGRSRTNYEYVDVEANWDKSDAETSKEVSLLKKKMKELNDNKKFSVFLNLHSQASPYCTFWIHTAASTTENFYRRQYQFANLNISGNPYFVRNDYRESSLKATFPEGWLYYNYGEDVLALTYETPYDKYSTGEWVTNENLFELGSFTLHGIAEFLQLSHPRKMLLDNMDAFGIGTITSDTTGLEFYGENYYKLESGKESSITYSTPEVPSGMYEIEAWWPSDISFAGNLKYIMEGGGNSISMEKNQKTGGGKWNMLGELDLPKSGSISLKIKNDGTSPAAADAFRIIYKGISSGVKDIYIPEGFVLHQNFPNPFNPETRIRYDLTRGAIVNLVIYDMLGREIRVLESDYKSAGTHEVVFDASGLSSGIYVYTLNVDKNSISRKMIYIK